MNNNILKGLGGDANFYPNHLEQQYPHLFDRIFTLWDSPEFDTEINHLLLDKRDHFRQGFPTEVASELLRLSVLHSEQAGKIVPDGWVDSSDIKIE